MSLSLTFPGCGSHPWLLQPPSSMHSPLPWAQAGGCWNSKTANPGTAREGLPGCKKEERKVRWKSEIRIGNGYIRLDFLFTNSGRLDFLFTVVHSKMCRDTGWWKPSRDPMEPVEMRSAVPVTCWCVMHPGADSSSYYFGGSPLFQGSSISTKQGIIQWWFWELGSSVSTRIGLFDMVFAVKNK